MSDWLIRDVPDDLVEAVAQAPASPGDLKAFAASRAGIGDPDVMGVAWY